MNRLFGNIGKKRKRPVKYRILSKIKRLKWFLGLLLFIIFLVCIISYAEVKFNDSFDSIGDIFYWAMVTITTVGYGEIVPKTGLGKFLTVFLIVTGVVLVSFMTASIASILTATRIREGMGLKKVELEGHTVICGANFNMERVIRSIISVAAETPELVLINSRPEGEISDLIESFPETSIRFVYGDYTLESTLARASIAKASSAIILADSGPEGTTTKPDDRTLLAVLAIKSISQEIKVYVELLDAANEVHLERAGVDQIVLAAEFNGFLLASAVMSPGIPQALKEIMHIDYGTDIGRLKFPQEMIGKTFRDAVVAYLELYGNILLGVITEKKSFNMETVLAGDNGAIDDFIRRKFSEAGRNLKVESKGRITVRINPNKDYIITEDDFAVVLTTNREENTI